MNKFEKFDKQIYFIKIVLWDFCPLRCSYCFVDKDNRKVIKKDTLKNIIDLLLYSPWKNKLLHLLWWEPLLFWDEIIFAVEYSRKLSLELDKDLDISFCTTWLYFDKNKLSFINENKIYLAWSIDWPKHIHDKNRKKQNWLGSFDDVIKKKELVLDNIEDTHLWIAITVDKNVVDNLFDSYKYLVNDEWFKCTINIAPVDWVYWWKKLEKVFIEEVVKVHEYIISEIEKWRFLFLNSLNKEFRFNMLSVFRKKWRCLWFYTEAFYTWEILFNPFVNKEEDYSKFVVSNIDDDNFMKNIDKYIWCKFDYKSIDCDICKKDYFSEMMWNNLNNIKLNKLLNFRDRISVLYANKIRLKAKNGKNFKEYINIAKDMMYV